MNEEVGFLTRDDQQLIRQLLADYKNGRLNPVNRTPIVDQDLPAPEVYLIRTTAEGLFGYNPGSTGTASDDIFDTQDCKVYAVVRNGSSFTTTTVRYMGFTIPVYNWSLAAIAPDVWCLAVRDKGGPYYAAVPPSTFAEGAIAGMNTPMFVPDSTLTNAVFTGTTYDTGSYFSLGSPTKIYCPKNGIYDVVVYAVWSPPVGTVVGPYREISIIKNGTVPAFAGTSDDLLESQLSYGSVLSHLGAGATLNQVISAFNTLLDESNTGGYTRFFQQCAVAAIPFSGSPLEYVNFGLYHDAGESLGVTVRASALFRGPYTNPL